MLDAQVTLDGLVAYYQEAKTQPALIREALKLSKDAYNEVCLRNKNRAESDPEGHKALIAAVKKHFAKPFKSSDDVLEI